MALPAAYAAYVAAQAKDPIAERFLSPFRIAILSFAAETFVAALSLVFRINGLSLRSLWAVVGVVALDTSIVVTAAWIRARMFGQPA